MWGVRNALVLFKKKVWNSVRIPLKLCSKLFSTLFPQICYNFLLIVILIRHVRKTKDARHTKAKSVALASTNARNVSASGCRAIHGQTWHRNASSVRSRFIHTNRLVQSKLKYHKFIPPSICFNFKPNFYHSHTLL